MPDEFTGFGPAFDTDHLRQRRGNGLERLQSLAWQRQVVQRAASRIKIPLPRLIQELESALDVIKITRLQSEDRALAEVNDALLFVHAHNRQAGPHPLRHRYGFPLSSRALR